MTPAVLLVVLSAAALHATWNAIVKGGDDTMMTTILVIGSAALLAAAGLPLLPPPDRPSWPFIAASSVLHVGYFVLIAQTYRVADMSQAYPLMRGTAPLLVAFASVGLLHETLAPLAWLGIAAICGGILGMAVGCRSQGKGVALALIVAAVIASYTLVDGTGVRRSGNALAYTLWMFLLTGGPLLAWALATRGRAFSRYLRGNWRPGLAGGFGTVASYALVLWAMTVAPIAIVAAVRETAIVFGTAISGLVLKERLGPARIVGAVIIAIGVVAIRLA